MKAKDQIKHVDQAKQDQSPPKGLNQSPPKEKKAKQLPKLTEEQKQASVEQLKKFIETTGISDAFQIVFAEIIAKNMKEEHAYQFAADRLREIGKSLATEQMKAKLEVQKKESITKKK